MSDYQPTMIRDLPKNQRPRERLQEFGASVLADGELLAILLRTGSSNESVLHLAERLIVQFGSLKGLAMASFASLTDTAGIGPAKASEIQACMEIGKRLAAHMDGPRSSVRCPEDVYTLLGTEMRYLSQEQFRTLCLDSKGYVIRSPTVTKGILNASIVEAREVYREALSCNAASLIAVHNHPSGDPTPSPEDISLTKRLVDAGKTIGIECLDHVVIGDRTFASMKERGLM